MNRNLLSMMELLLQMIFLFNPFCVKKYHFIYVNGVKFCFLRKFFTFALKTYNQ